MSDFKVGAPGRPPLLPQVERSDRGEPSGKAFEIAGQATTSPNVSSTAVESTTAVSPEDVIQRLRSGQITVDQAIEIMIDQALSSQPAASVSERLRGDIRQALSELVQEDPTLVALTSAMKR